MHVPWELDGNGCGKFGRLTQAQRDYLLQELEVEDPVAQQKALDYLEAILSDYQNWIHYKAGVGKPTDEPKRLQRAVAALAEAQAAIEALGPDSKMLFFDPDNEEDLIPIEDLLAGMAYWQSEFHDEFRSSTTSKGAPKNFPLEFAIRKLARLYKMASGKTPGYSSPPIDVSPESKHSLYGPFVRFCRNAIVVVNPDARTSVENKVRDVCRHGKKSHPDWPLVPTTWP